MKVLKKISAVKARQNLGQVMNEVALKEDDYIVERAGKPLVAIVSMATYQRLRKEREAVFKELDAIWTKMKGEDKKLLKKTINEAVKAARSL